MTDNEIIAIFINDVAGYMDMDATLESVEQLADFYDSVVENDEEIHRLYKLMEEARDRVISLANQVRCA